MRDVYLKEHLPLAVKEINCIEDLCERIITSSKKLEIEQANQYKEDLLKSLASLTDLHSAKVKQDETIDLVTKQIEGERQQLELITEQLRLNNKEVDTRRNYF